MLEIVGIMMLCKANKRNAIARGRRPGGYIALTIILWVGMELLGFFIGAMAELEYGRIFLAYGLAGIGALISFLVAKFGPKGDYVDPATARTMSSSVDMNAPMMGSYNVPVDQSSYAPYQNATYGQQPLQYQDPLQGTPYADPGMAQQPSPFVPQSSSSPFVPQQQSAFVPQQQSPYAEQPYDAQSPYAPQPAPFAGQPSPYAAPSSYAAPAATAAAVAEPVAAQPKFCGSCGSPLKAGSHFCDNCGAQIN